MFEETKCTVTDVNYSSNKQNPIIVSFQNGLLQSDYAPKFECRVSNDHVNEEKRIVEMSSSESIVYKGSEPPPVSKICRTLLAIRNKSTNHIRLIEAESIQLAPFLPNDLLDINIGAEQVDKSFATLNKTFGSKRVKRRTELRERMMFEVQTMANQLNQAASGVEIAEEDLSVPLVDNLDSLIPCNKLASSVDQVYKLSDIITQNELDSMQEEAERMFKNKEICSEDQYSRYFLHYLQKCLAGNDVHYLKLLLYAECLLKLYRLHSVEIRKKTTVICPFSKVIDSKIFNSFTIDSKNRRSCPLSMQDKILSHVIILGVLANNFKLDLEPLVKTQKIKAVRVLELCRVLRLVPASRSNKFVVTLKLPLPSPVKQNSRKRKRN